MKTKSLVTGNGIVVGAFIAVCIWLAGFTGAVRVPDGYLYDLFVSIGSAGGPSRSGVLLIGTRFDTRHEGDDVWLKLLDTLVRFEARQVVFTFFPPGASPRFYDEASRSGKVLFGREALGDFDGAFGEKAEPLPAEAKGGLSWGMLAFPPDDYGSYRSQYSRVTVAGKPLPTLEALAAHISGGSDLPGTNTFLVNFMAGSGGIPQTTLEHALAGGLISELVKGRTVVIGYTNGPHAPGLRTPASGGRRISLLEYRGYALNTLLSRSAITEIPQWARFIILAAIIFIGLSINSLFEIRAFSWLTVTAAIAFLAGCWLLLFYLRIRLPIADTLAAYAVTYSCVIGQRMRSAERAVRDIILDLSSELKRLVMPESFFSSQEYWSQVITMVNQALNLNRTIFLEKVPNDHRVREVKALHCSITDIHEKRRDYTRTPYSEAISSAGPIRLEKTLFLKKIETEEDQYLVPLTFGGMTLGFWAFGIEPARVGEIPLFKEVIRDFGRQISELLFRRTEWRHLEQTNRSFLANYMDLGRDTPHEELKKTLELFERRFNTLEAVFSVLGTAAILYDLFGRVILVNARMAEILKNVDIPPYETTALDLAVALSGLTPESVRLSLHSVILEQREMSLPASDLESNGTHFSIRIRPLLTNDRKPLMVEACPFSAYGILFELVDVTDLTQQSRSRELLSHHFFHQLLDRLEGITATADLLVSEKAPTEEREDSLLRMRDTIAGTEIILRRASRWLYEEPRSGCRPIDGIAVLEKALANRRGLMEEQGILLEMHLPATRRLVLGEPEALGEALRAMLEFLINDAARESTLTINVTTEEDRLILQLANSGFGIPTKTFSRCLFTDEHLISAELTRLRIFARRIAEWDGRVDAESDIGAGTRFVVSLKNFL